MAESVFGGEILFIKNFLVTSYILLGIAIIISGCESDNSSAPDDCSDIDSVDFTIDARWVKEGSELLIFVEVTVLDERVRPSVRSYGVTNAELPRSITYSVDSVEFLCRPISNSEELIIFIELKCNGSGFWESNFSFSLDYTEPEEGKYLPITIR